MDIKKIFLKDINPALSDSEATLTIYRPERNEWVTSLDMMLVCPGGAYEYCSQREGEIVALRFVTEGFVAAVLNYTVKTKYPAPQLEVGASVDYLRKHVKELDATSKVGIVGFSAGGHLVTSYGCWYKEIAGMLSLEEENLRPTGIIAGYPVISTSVSDISMTTKNIAAGEEELLDKMSVEKHVSSDYPPTFLFVTRGDNCVNPKNSEVFERALTEKGVKHIYLVGESGEHGCSLCNRSVFPEGHIELEKTKSLREWPSLSGDFIHSL